MRTLSGTHGPGAVAGQFEICGNLDVYGELLLPILTGEEVLALQVLIHEITSVLARFTRRSRGNLNAIILRCSEAQTNRQVKFRASS